MSSTEVNIVGVFIVILALIAAAALLILDIYSGGFPILGIILSAIILVVISPLLPDCIIFLKVIKQIFLGGGKK